MLHKQYELDPRSLLRLKWFSHTFETMTLWGLIHLRLKLLWLWLHIVAAVEGKLWFRRLPRAATKLLIFAMWICFDRRKDLCAGDIRISIFNNAMGKFSIPTEVTLLMETKLAKRVIDSYLLYFTKNVPSSEFFMKVKNKICIAEEYAQIHTNICKFLQRYETYANF